MPCLKTIPSRLQGSDLCLVKEEVFRCVLCGILRRLSCSGTINPGGAPRGVKRRNPEEKVNLCPVAFVRLLV